MALLVDMGVNACQYDVIPPRWVEYLRNLWDLHHQQPRRPIRCEINGVWVPQIDYSDEATRSELRKQLMDSSRNTKTPQGLMILGNENSTTSLTLKLANSPKTNRRLRRRSCTFVWWLTDAIHEVDPHHPVGLTNGDLQYIDILAEQCDKSISWLKRIVASSRDLFDEVKEMNVPFLYTEFGSDAYNAKHGKRMPKHRPCTYTDNGRKSMSTVTEGRANNAIGGPFSNGVMGGGNTSGRSISTSMTPPPAGQMPRTRSTSWMTDST